MATRLAEQVRNAFRQDPNTDAPASARNRRVAAAQPRQQSVAVDQFFYFFLRLRKGEVRRIVQRVKTLYPGETPEQLARRLILAQSSLSLVGGALLYLPMLFPVAGNVLKMVGFVGGASMLTRVNLYLILEIALLYGKDIDDQARVPELMAVIAASGLSATSPLLVSRMDWHPAASIPASGVMAAATAKLIGEAAIAFYQRPQTVLSDVGGNETEPGIAPATA
ncbi:hypothetical protein [Methylotetracoccus oryzae]|uniref:hypothetical protein n=1 Tax=Methylotetracoccus oryzae TaxID=1919059 RepID=UPI00111878BD|nr:hypothetical protein [Methylotetracoccus oryzae]